MTRRPGLGLKEALANENTALLFEGSNNGLVKVLSLLPRWSPVHEVVRLPLLAHVVLLLTVDGFIIVNRWRRLDKPFSDIIKTRSPLLPLLHGFEDDLDRFW
ncbi:hypothetical protein F441_02108 [Phytophthora nicotianae CJ01A1]|uniref:Uncharacterized protein n=2 Tax=Phytophthora nicotianae TaxID=4792 RepID=V9FVU0_PHYNI|nr:hypothetical protein F443_02129 [Phytophthora nicotianae P1569]ETP24989.1 hypothetical protein F441_02108 [Phytophthora nicotianae CJ01A1]